MISALTAASPPIPLRSESARHRLTVNIGQSTVAAGDPVNLFTGALYDDETDVSLPNVASRPPSAGIRLSTVVPTRQTAAST